MLLCHFLQLSTFSFPRLLPSHSIKFKMATRLLSSKISVNFKAVTHVIFDMDGLLLDTERVYKKIISEIVQSYGKDYTKEIQLMVLGTTEQLTAKILVEECNLPITVEEFLKQFRSVQLSQLANADLMEGAYRLVNHFYNNKVPMAVATSSGKESVAVKTKNHKELFQLFNHIVMGSSDPEVKQGKPAPDIFQVCAKRFKDKPEFGKCLVFEDAPNGVTGAIAAGMQAVMVPDTFLPPEKTSHATLVINSLLEFKPEDFGLPPFQDLLGPKMLIAMKMGETPGQVKRNYFSSTKQKIDQIVNGFLVK